MSIWHLALMFPLELRAKVSREETRVMGLLDT